MTARLHASEQDADDDQDDIVDKVTDDEAQDGVGSDDQDDETQDDQTDDQSSDDADADTQQTSRVDDKGRAIARRARETREPAIDPVQLATETAAATARTIAASTAQAARQAEAERREQTVVDGMTDEQRATYTLAKTTKNLQNDQQVTQLMLRSSTDQNQFGRLIMRKPQYEKYETEVEKRHQNTLSQGNFVSREVLLAHLIGERALKNEKNQQQRQGATRRVESQRSQNAGRSTRGDGGGTTAQTQRSSAISRAEKEDWAI